VFHRGGRMRWVQASGLHHGGRVAG
jgi:hypothetical protein